MKNSIIGIGLGICVSLGLAGALSYFKLDNKVNVISNNTATPDCLVKSMTVFDNNGNIESITSNFIDVKEKYELEDIVEVVETDAEVLEPVLLQASNLWMVACVCAATTARALDVQN